jgi:hypothetical protein
VKTRFSFALMAGLLMVILVVALLPSPQTTPAPVKISGTPMKPAAPTETPLPVIASPIRLPVSPTSIPRKATYTSQPAETPDMLATQTLLPIPTETLIFFATTTSTPFGGTATSSVPMAYAPDRKPVACYKGPGAEYIPKTTIKLAQIIGRDETGKWWYLIVHQGQGAFIYCWVSDEKVAIGGNLSDLLVVEPELAQITQIKIDATTADLIQTTSCANNSTLHFTGHIFSDGPLQNISYAWDTDSQVRLPRGQISIKSWDAPAEIKLEFPAPAQAGTYFLRLSTTYPMENSGTLQFEVKCK